MAKQQMHSAKSVSLANLHKLQGATEATNKKDSLFQYVNVCASWPQITIQTEMSYFNM
jgi:hypothetical protein